MLLHGSVRFRYKKLIFKVFLKFLHISCHVNCFMKMAFFRCLWSKFDSESPLVWSFKSMYNTNGKYYFLSWTLLYQPQISTNNGQHVRDIIFGNKASLKPRIKIVDRFLLVNMNEYLYSIYTFTYGVWGHLILDNEIKNGKNALWFLLHGIWQLMFMFLI